MKNILNKNEFKDIKKYQLIQESLDFSNKVGWSDCLVGRLVNKLFSFGAKQYNKVILNNLKQKLDDQYSKAIYSASAEMKLELKEKEKPNVSEKEVAENAQAQENNVDVNDVAINEPIKVKSQEISTKLTLSELYDEINNFTSSFDSEKASEQSKSAVINLNDMLIKFNDKMDKTSKAIQSISEDSKYSNQVMKYKQHEKDFIELTKKFNELEPSLKQKTSVVSANKMSDEELKKYTEIVNEIPEDFGDKYWDELTTIFDNTIKNFKDDEKEEKREQFDHMVNEAKKKTIVEQYIIYKRVKKHLKTLITDSLNITKLEKLNEYFNNILNEGSSLAVKDTSIKLKNVFSEYDDEKSKEIKKSYGNIDLNKLDIDSFIEDFKKNQELRKKAIKNVNKEALKEIALRAAWIYDDEKYKSQRNDHYTRVNFTKTSSDNKALENMWLKSVASIKAAYTPFLADESGNFPKDLDPIALMNSDKAFRTSFNQYSKDDADKNSQIGSDPSFNSSNLFKETINSLGLKQIQPKTDEYVLIRVAPYKRSNIYGLLCKNKIENGMVLLTYIGIIDILKIEKEIYDDNNNIVSEDKIQEIIKKYNYANLNNLSNISNETDKSDLRKIINYYHPIDDSEFKNKKLTTKYIKKLNSNKLNDYNQIDQYDEYMYIRKIQENVISFEKIENIEFKEDSYIFKMKPVYNGYYTISNNKIKLFGIK